MLRRPAQKPMGFWNPYFSSDLGWVVGGAGSWFVAGALGIFPASEGPATGPACEVSAERGAYAFSPCPGWLTPVMIENCDSPGFVAFAVLAQLSWNQTDYTLLV